ncbi:MAG: hypothetical protein DLM61_19430 [Pseudonocardiales bacterium]|nr:MAG: hypothetical protein DLM61_19430 [Pseudonocardiales bacterium]
MATEPAILSATTWSVRFGVDVGYRMPEHEADALEQRAGELVSDPLVATTERGAEVMFWVEGQWCDAAATAQRLADGLGQVPVEVAIRAQHLVEAEAAAPTLPELLGATEVAALLGVSRQRVHQLHTGHPAFPAALVEVAMGPLWDARAIARFERDWDRRPGRRASIPVADADERRGAECAQ